MLILRLHTIYRIIIS